MQFQAFAAMERNKYIYAPADFAAVVSSEYPKGGTWAGAAENLRHGWTPMFVRSAENMPEGNARLLENENVLPMGQDIPQEAKGNILDWFASQAGARVEMEKCHQQTLFDLLP